MGKCDECFHAGNMIQGCQNGFQSGGTMEHLGDSLLIVSALKPFLFSFCFHFFFLLRKTVCVGGMSPEHLLSSFSPALWSLFYTTE